MTQVPKNGADTLPAPSEEELEEYVEVVFDNGEGSRDRYATIVVDDEGQAHTLSAGQDRHGECAILEVYDGRPKYRTGRRIAWQALPSQCQALFWQQVRQINEQYR